MRSKRWIAVGLSVASATAALAIDGRGDDKDAQASARTLLQAAEAYDRNDCVTTVKLVGPVIDRKDPAIPDRLLAAAYDLVVSCEYRLGKEADGAAHAIRGTALDDSSDMLWHVRLTVQIEKGENAAAVATLERMLLGRGAALASVKPAWLWRLHTQVRDSGDDVLTLRVAKVMADKAYEPQGLGWDRDNARVLYARALLKTGNTGAARTVVAEVEGLMAMLQIVFDPDLSSLRGARPDLRVVAETQLVRDRETMTLNHTSLAAVINVARDLRHLGRPAEALRVLKAVQPRLAEPDAFTDADEELIWWWDSVGRSQAAMGNYDAMLEAFEQGAQKAENGLPNVSQTINLASFQLGFGRADEAMKTLSVFEGAGRLASPYGEMQVRGVRGCALARLGDTRRAAAVLKEAQARQKDDRMAVTDLYLCNGDIEGAAAAYIARLRDPALRASALMDLSTFDPREAKAPVDAKRGPIALVLSRADVKAAVAAVGGLRTVHLQRAELY